MKRFRQSRRRFTRVGFQTAGRISHQAPKVRNVEAWANGPGQLLFSPKRWKRVITKTIMPRLQRSTINCTES